MHQPSYVFHEHFPVTTTTTKKKAELKEFCLSSFTSQYYLVWKYMYRNKHVFYSSVHSRRNYDILFVCYLEEKKTVNIPIKLKTDIRQVFFVCTTSSLSSSFFPNSAIFFYHRTPLRILVVTESVYIRFGTADFCVCVYDWRCVNSSLQKLSQPKKLAAASE